MAYELQSGKIFSTQKECVLQFSLRALAIHDKALDEMCITPLLHPLPDQIRKRGSLIPTIGSRHLE